MSKKNPGKHFNQKDSTKIKKLAENDDHEGAFRAKTTAVHKIFCELRT